MESEDTGKDMNLRGSASGQEKCLGNNDMTDAHVLDNFPSIAWQILRKNILKITKCLGSFISFRRWRSSTRLIRNLIMPVSTEKQTRFQKNKTQGQNHSCSAVNCFLLKLEWLLRT